MYKYAQIDINTRLCICVSELSGIVDAPHMIPLFEMVDDFPVALSEVNPGDILNEDGTWTPAPPIEPPEPQPDRIAQLQAENADLKSRIADIELAFADIISGGGI